MTKVEQTDVPIHICERPKFNRDGTMEEGGEFVMELPDVAEALDNALDLPLGFREDHDLHVRIDRFQGNAMTVEFTFRRQGE